MKQASWVLFILVFSTGIYCQESVINPPALVFAEGGYFRMSVLSETGDTVFETDSISSFYIGKYEITIGQYREFCQATGYQQLTGGNDREPVVNVSARDAEAYCAWLGKTYGGVWRLPNSKEWKYAARGGNKTKNYTFIGGDGPGEVSWFCDNSQNRIHEVGKKKPNEHGIFDMQGNVWEWSSDGYIATSEYNEKITRDLLGGSFEDSMELSGVNSLMDEDGFSSSVGFRVVKEINK